MHVVTFYSYKGGVGRSMALANVAYALAAAGRRVLAIDFDLEAPGLCSYSAFKAADDRPGIVEFVDAYLRTGEAPDVSEYITRCEFAGTTLWTMPAGRHRQPGYSAMLGSIDWQRLYADHDGFLLMEDLKEQWRLFDGSGFDYVLIDSRTGHTDVGGVCTRHLPDSVVVLFVPTPQNIEGLEPIVQVIGGEAAPVRVRPVKLHFCPSNVPDLDDDEEILAGLLEEARTRLGYTSPAAVIQHYRSLDLLLQPIAVQSNPGSRLSKQYEELRRSIVGENLSDREGALYALDRARIDFEAVRSGGTRADADAINKRVETVRALWPNDPKIAWKRAELANALMRSQDEIDALDVAIDHLDNVGRARLRRAYAHSALGNHDAAVLDLQTLLTKDGGSQFEMLPAVGLLRSLRPDILRDAVRAALLNERVDPGGQGILLSEFLTSHADLRETADIASALLEVHGDTPETTGLRNVLILALIGLGRFGEALDAFRRDRASILRNGTMDVVFNYAVAEWGATGTSPGDLLARVLALRAQQKGGDDANMLQCLALCRGALGLVEPALGDLDAAATRVGEREKIFTCWRYLQVAPADFRTDLAAMRRMLEQDGTLLPPVLSAESKVP